MKIAIAQLNPKIGDLGGNVQLILSAAQTAVEQSCHLLLTPELALCGYPPRDLLMNPSFLDKIAEQLQFLAEQLPPQLAVLVGCVTRNLHAEKLGEKDLFNSAVLCYHHQLQNEFHKRLLPTYDVFDEDRYFEPGKVSDYFSLNGVKIGVTICEDLWNNQDFFGKRHYQCNPLEDLAKLEVNLVVNLSASPYRVNKQSFRESMLRYNGSQYGLPMVYTNQVGGNDDLIFDGGSVALNRQGDLIARSPVFESDLRIIEYEESQQDLVFSEEKSQTKIIAPLPESQDEEIWLALVLGVRDYVKKCGFSKVVIGLSGGIDSALVAAIATEAIGRENVLGVLMPSPYSSEHSLKDALELGENLGIETTILPIRILMNSYEEILSKLFAGTSFGLAEENIQSRIRGNLLMAISNKFGHLLLSTGNKSELAVGYCTLYGDMNGGLAVIADVPKVRVYSICSWLNRQSFAQENRLIIPENILKKSPSAELKPGQKDQDSLPPYEILDDILYYFIEQCESPDKIIERGHDPDTVKRVIQLIMRAEFKRRQAPPGLKISDRAFGTGWRMPIAKSSEL